MSAETAVDATPDELPADGAAISRLGLRDGALALAGLSLFGAAEAWSATSGLALATLVSVLDGVVVGLGLGFLAHEWGHFAGARLAGGIAPTRPLGWRVFPLFDFDLQRSDPAAFRAMGLGGNLAHWGLVALWGVALPLATPGQVGLLAASAGFAVFASATEVPVLQRAYAGASAIESFGALSGEKLKRNQWIGLAVGLALLALL